MSITRRDALTAAIGCGLTTAAPAGADDKPAVEPPERDSLLAALPPAARKVVEYWFPNYWCVRLVTDHRANPKSYQATLFTPRGPRRVNWIDGQEVVVPPTYQITVNAEGKVLEEANHPIEKTRVPKAVIAAYEKWNSKGVRGMVTTWNTEVAVGKGRIYRVGILISQIKFYAAAFQEDGTVISADPIDAP